MAKIKIAGNVFVVESACTKEEIKLAGKYDNKVLTLFDENKKPCFAVGYGDKGSLNRFGIVFDSETQSGDSVACVTLPLPEGSGDAKKRVAEYIGTSLRDLELVEAQVADKIADIKLTEAATMDAIVAV